MPKDDLETARKKNRLKYGSVEEIIEIVKEDGSFLKYCETDLLMDHPSIVFAALETDGTWIRFIQDDFAINNVDMVYAAVKKNGYALQYASSACRNDPFLVSTAIAQNGFALWFASDTIRNMATIVQAAVAKNGLALQFASPALKSDRTIVSIAINNHGMALEYASNELRADRAIVQAAVSQNWQALRFALGGLNNDVNLIATATISAEGLLPQNLIGSTLKDKLVEVVTFLLHCQPCPDHLIKHLSYKELMDELCGHWLEKFWIVRQLSIANDQQDSIISYSDFGELKANIVKAKALEPIFSATKGDTWEDQVNMFKPKPTESSGGEENQVVSAGTIIWFGLQ